MNINELINFVRACEEQILNHVNIVIIVSLGIKWARRLLVNNEVIAGYRVAG